MPSLFDAILSKGEENAVSTEHLQRILGVPDARTIRRMVSEERAAGSVILSSNRGYFFPDDGEKGRQEALAFVATVTAKGAETIRAAKSAKEYLSRLPGQMEVIS